MIRQAYEVFVRIMVKHYFDNGFMGGGFDVCFVFKKCIDMWFSFLLLRFMAICCIYISLQRISNHLEFVAP